MNDELGQAITAALEANDMLADGEFPTDWLVIVALEHPSGETAYSALVSGGQLPEHRARGLLAVAPNCFFQQEEDK